MSIIQELSEQRFARHHSNFTGYLYSVYYCHLYIFKIKFKKLKDLLRFIYVVLYSQHSLRNMFLPRPSHILHIRKCVSENWVACPKCWSENSNPASHISLGLSTSVQACPAYNYQHPGLFAWGLSLAAGGTNPHPMTRTAAEYPNSCPWGWGWLWNTVYTGSQGSPTGSSSPLHGDLLDNAHFIGCLPFPDSLSCSPAGISFTSLIDHLHINLCFRVCFWGNSN